MAEEMNTQYQAEASLTECEQCGGDMKFDPATASLQCISCGALRELEQSNDNIEEIDWNDRNQFDFDWKADKEVLVCENCGGQTIIDTNAETGFCDYCGSQHIIRRSEENMGMCPQGVLPFAIDLDEARGRLRKWIGRRYMSPRELKNQYKSSSFGGIYVPYWTFDTETYTRYKARIGTYYYVGSGEDRKRKVRWRNHNGSYRQTFDDYLVPAVFSEQERLLKKIEPFDTFRSLVDYSPEYLAGYHAWKYTIQPDSARENAKTQMKDEIRQRITSRLPGDTYKHYHQDVFFDAFQFKHILLPVYMATYTYNKKTFHVLINGQTGEVQGEAPVSWVKIGLIAAAVIGIFLILHFNEILMFN